MIAVGDVKLDMSIRVTLKGTPRELGAFMETLTASRVVTGVTAEAISEGKGSEEAAELCERFGLDKGA